MPICNLENYLTFGGIGDVSFSDIFLAKACYIVELRTLQVKSKQQLFYK